MNKICPYCGRIGTLGTSCEGCGYVLQESDKSAAAPSAYQAVSPPPTSPPPTPAVQPKPFKFDTDLPPDRKCERGSFVHTIPPFIKKIVNMIGWIIAIPIFFISLIGTTVLQETFEQSFQIGSLTVLMLYFFINTALLILHITHFKTLRGVKYFKYSFIAIVILILIVGFFFS